MAAASASPVILMLEALASPFNRVASAWASARTALALAWAPRHRDERLLLLEKLGNRGCRLDPRARNQHHGALAGVDHLLLDEFC
jgi:hypothetical protein